MIQISDNTLYYTFSTVAQSLAAAVAFLGAFVLFKIQAAESRLTDSLSSFADRVTRGPAHDRMMVAIRSRQFQQAMEFIKINPNQLGSEFESAFKEIEQEIEAIRHAKVVFRDVMYFAISMIVISLIGLAIVDSIKSLSSLHYLLWVYVAVSCCVLVSMAKLMRNMIINDPS